LDLLRCFDALQFDFVGDGDLSFAVGAELAGKKNESRIGTSGCKRKLQYGIGILAWNPYRVK